MPDVSASVLDDLGKLSKECFRHRKQSTCRFALVIAETLQNKADESQQYECQSRLLGLSTDLIMISMGNSYPKSAWKMLQEVRVSCKDL